jgi:rubrerythrin
MVRGEADSRGAEVELRRCLICGQVNGGIGSPRRCAFCGSPLCYVVPVAAWIDENLDLGNPPDDDLELVRHALQIEVDNAAFYYAAMRAADTPAFAGLFRYVWKIEREHQSLLHKLGLAKMPRSDPSALELGADEAENVELAWKKERASAGFYLESARSCEAPRLRRVFGALASVESDHLKLHESYAF